MQEYNNTFRILICSDNDGVIQNLNTKLEEMLKNIPYELKIVKDGVRAINELSKNICQLFITDSNPVGIEIHYLLKHYQEINGGGSIIVLQNADAKEKDSQFENCEVIAWPISAWNEFEDCLKNSIPEEIKIKYGLAKIIPLKFKSLTKLVEKYHADTTDYHSDAALVIMPATFFDQDMSETQETKMQIAFDEKITVIGENNKKYSLYLEILFLIIMFSINIYVFKKADFDSEAFFSIRMLTTSLTGFIFLILVSNWTLRRYIMQISNK